MKEFTSFLFLLSQGRKGQVQRNAPAPARRGRGCAFLSGHGAGCRARRFSSAAAVFVVVWCVLFCKFPEPLSLQGSSSNFLVLRIKAHKTIRVSHVLWGPVSSGKESLRKGLLSCYYTCIEIPRTIHYKKRSQFCSVIIF